MDQIVSREDAKTRRREERSKRYGPSEVDIKALALRDRLAALPPFSNLRGFAASREPFSIRLAGYASVFDRVDRGGDVVRSGAFAASLRAGRVVPLLWQHRPGAVVGTIEALAEDRRGLRG